MPSVIQICNMAIGRVAGKAQISTLNEASVAAELCSLYYEEARDSAIRDIRPRFARRAQALAAVAGQTFPGWQFVYQLPTDCLFIESVVPETGMRTSQSFPGASGFHPLLTQVASLSLKIPYDVSSYAGGKTILCDLDEAWAIYFGRVEDPTLFDSGFVQALSFRLAMDLAMPLTKEPRILSMVERGYEIAKSVAREGSLSEAQEDPMPESPSILARR